jgi:hypothetical protein
MMSANGPNTRLHSAPGLQTSNRWHLQIAERWVVQYNFYVNDDRWGRMFVRVPVPVLLGAGVSQ